MWFRTNIASPHPFRYASRITANRGMYWASYISLFKYLKNATNQFHYYYVAYGKQIYLPEKEMANFLVIQCFP